MSDEHVYRIVEFAGSSETGIENAIEQAIGKAGNSLEHLRWFEVVNMRGHIRDGRVAHYQVTLKLGFTLESTLRT